METKAEYVTDDPLGELLDDFGHAAHDLYNGYGNCYDKYEHDIREYVDAMVSNGITAQIADLLEQVAALEIVIDAKEQTIAAMRARIDELQAELASETRWAKQYHDQWQAALSDLRELQA